MQAIKQIMLLIILVAGLAACSRPAPEGADGVPAIVATTSLIADVAGRVAGEHVQIIALMQPGQDPHTYEPAPADVAKLQSADLVFANGLGYEESLVLILEELEAGGKVRIVTVSEGVDLLPGSHHHHEDGEHEDEDDHENDHAVGDPHTWMDPNNVKIWVDNIAAALADIDPDNAEAYWANADAYKAHLVELDAFIAGQVDVISQADRKLVTDHEALGYFARRYGFEAVGAVIPNVSTAAEPSAADLAALVTVIREQNVRAIFVGSTVNDTLSQQVAAEIGHPVQILPLYYTLGSPSTGADTYLSMMRVNIETVVKGLMADD
ncbi:MAG: zinc ABC transporter substrate-binding protein [Anaerolineae bacterium]|nr:zinc ABC transporter substrate-binding protein [Anaerolineae bacterium]